MDIRIKVRIVRVRIVDVRIVDVRIVSENCGREDRRRNVNEDYVLRIVD